MAYQYDVFVSYRRKSKNWVHEYFLPLFEYHLQEAVGGRAINIFVDTEDIEGGDAWPQRLHHALAHSKCLVPVLLPSYFHSAWCVKELAIMEARCRRNGLWSIQNPGGLIVPVCISDGDFFPDSVKEIQALPCHDYHRTGPGFRNLEPYTRFEEAIMGWTVQVARAIERAPDWNQDWLTKEWLEVAIDHLLLSETSIIPPQPRI